MEADLDGALSRAGARDADQAARQGRAASGRCCGLNRKDRHARRRHTPPNPLKHSDPGRIALLDGRRKWLPTGSWTGSRIRTGSQPDHAAAGRLRPGLATIPAATKWRHAARHQRPAAWAAAMWLAPRRRSGPDQCAASGGAPAAPASRRPARLSWSSTLAGKAGMPATWPAATISDHRPGRLDARQLRLAAGYTSDQVGRTSARATPRPSRAAGLAGQRRPLLGADECRFPGGRAGLHAVQHRAVRLLGADARPALRRSAELSRGWPPPGSDLQDVLAR